MELTEMMAGKTLFVISAIACLVGILAATASAEFETTNGKTEGAGVGSEMIIGGGGLASKCIKVAYTFQEKKGKPQELVKLGPHETYWLTTWNTCSLNGFEVKISESKTQAENPTKGMIPSTGTAKVESAMTLSAAFCVVKIPAIEANENLGKIGLSNSGTNQIAKLEVTGITDEVSEGCAMLGIKATKEGSITGVLTSEGQKLV
jgi:hypothetical protein